MSVASPDVQIQQIQPAGAVPPRGGMTPADLAELMAAFNEVTARLTNTHEQLRAEVERLQRELGEANSALERSRRLAALGEMAAGIAHEVRNPLGSIRLYAGLLEQDLAGMPGPRETVARIGGAARIIDQIVGDMLTFAREFRLSPSLMSADELFDQALAQCGAEATPGWSKVRVEREGGSAAVFADAGLAAQALANVVRNALDAVSEDRARGGVGLVRLVAREEGEGAVVSVIDDGPGVPPEVIPRMFNPFFTTRATGTGLGLAIVHRIMEAHGGLVMVANNADRTGDPGARGAYVGLSFPGAGAGTESRSRHDGAGAHRQGGCV